jgi:starch phosphorylase
VPLFFEHGPKGFSERWVRMSKHAVASILPRFSAHRMVMDYVNRLYVPAIHDGRRSRGRQPSLKFHLPLSHCSTRRK